MPLEKVGFRDQLQQLYDLYPGRVSIGIEEAAQIVGLNRRTLIADRTFPARKCGDKHSPTGGKYIVPLVGLARWLC
jgi:hypothetical protein